MIPDEGKVIPGSAKTIELSDQARLNELREQAQMAFEFGKFGFAGTLSGAFGGLVLLLALAVLQAFTDFKIETYGYVGILFSTRPSADRADASRLYIACDISRSYD
jgi:hypothetical protein